MSNPFEDLRQAVVVRPMNSPGPQGAAGPEIKIQYSNDGSSWHNDPIETDRYLRFSTDNGVSWSDAIYFNNLAETIEWVEKARQWAENPENDEVEAGKYSALHHATRAARSEFNAEAATLEAENLVSGAYGVAPPLWNSTTVYNYNDIVSFDNGQVYRCVGTNIVGANHAPNINGIDNKEDWARITAVLDGFFEIDENGDFMSMIAPINSDIFMLDENGDITYQDPIDIEASMATIELFTLDENGNIAYRDPIDHRPGGGNIELYKEMEFVDSIADFRLSRFYGTTKYVYVVGYYGKGTPGGGIFYKDTESKEDDNGGTVIVDSDNIRWKRANVHEEYYASWFGVSTDVDDNSPLIQNALNAMPSGSVLVFGPGVYKCEQTITIPDHPTRPEYVKNITIRSSTGFMATWGSNNTVLKYTGANPGGLTPFINFRGSTWDKRYIGLIQGMTFSGPGSNSNVVALWLNFCVETRFENVFISGFKYGIQINGHYYHCQFNNVTFMGCDYGFRSLSVANGAVFYRCSFIWCNICAVCDFTTSGENANIYFNNCYFQQSKTAIRPSIGRSLYINQCYFEAITEYILDVFSDIPNSTIDPIVVLENSLINVDPRDLISNKAVIRQTLASSNRILTLIIKNNSIVNQGIIPDYFVYVTVGNIKIQAENNKLKYLSDSFPICSKTPLDASYFNNDFS